ncbi:MAG: flavodoxin-dependent (E)-4-hydroxy-3-methylbut-2-enyl-diphosphate synthase, partial [Opitutales bacterium]|nr:flavodoxin-dependent (E)-4-hydroxy-3-methylbut-2-enyl-diphosphate synthase [Opitutales bacterium]
GTIKSCAGIGAILLNGIGDTIRVSLTGDPCEEVRVGRSLLHSLDLGGNNFPNASRCPYRNLLRSARNDLHNQV